MTDKEFDAILDLVAIMRTDLRVVHKALAAMTELGYSAEETQTAMNTISKRMMRLRPEQNGTKT
jgi:Holliday junction resolvasome RuvABC DNA-binding subunit